jgi:hypothetical protein
MPGVQLSRLMFYGDLPISFQVNTGGSTEKQQMTESIKSLPTLSLIVNSTGITFAID